MQIKRQTSDTTCLVSRPKLMASATNAIDNSWTVVYVQSKQILNYVLTLRDFSSQVDPWSK